jgi:hypothetical protein
MPAMLCPFLTIATIGRPRLALVQLHHRPEGDRFDQGPVPSFDLESVSVCGTADADLLRHDFAGADAWRGHLTLGGATCSFAG